MLLPGITPSSCPPRVLSTPRSLELGRLFLIPPPWVLHTLLLRRTARLLLPCLLHALLLRRIARLLLPCLPHDLFLLLLPPFPLLLRRLPPPCASSWLLFPFPSTPYPQACCLWPKLPLCLGSTPRFALWPWSGSRSLGLTCCRLRAPPRCVQRRCLLPGAPRPTRTVFARRWLPFVPFFRPLVSAATGA